MISALTGEFKQEAANTRKLLERVPQEPFSWKPHEKSMPLLRLALHIAEMTRWAIITLQQIELDFSKDYPKSPEIKSTAGLLSFFDQLKNEAIAALENIREETLVENWTLKNGAHIFLPCPKR